MSLEDLRAWSRAGRACRDGRLLSWATALTWGLVLNVYTPFYDCIPMQAQLSPAISTT